MSVTSPTTVPSPSRVPQEPGRLARLRHATLTGVNAAMPERRLRRLVGAGADIRTYTTVRERIALFEEAEAALSHPSANGTLIEVGSYLGATAVVLGEALRRRRHPAGHLYCIDTWQNDAMTEGKWNTFDEFTRNTAAYRSLITPLRTRSADAPLPADLVCDAVFIDGDHSYEGASEDLRAFLPTLAPHGRLLLHDHSSKPGVARVLGELLQSERWVILRSVGSLVSLKRAPWSSEG